MFLCKLKLHKRISFGQICHVMGLNRACLASISTKKIVQECPKSVEDFTKRAYEMNCHQIPQNCTSPDNFQYHCLPTEDRNIFVDVCAEVKYISCKYLWSSCLKKKILKINRSFAWYLCNILVSLTICRTDLNKKIINGCHFCDWIVFL